MRESQRLAYLEAIGVTGWVPRVPLAHAATRTPPEPEVATQPVEPERAAPVVSAGEPARSARAEAVDTQARPVVSSPSAALVEQRRAQVAAQPAKQLPPAEASAPLAEVSTSTPEAPAGQSVAPFYLQLWIAGPCALLIEIADPGLEKGTSEHDLLCDILRAAALPTAPRLQADFRWPLSRNPQVARSAEAASEALQAFMQARLELQPVSSIGCFGAMAGLLATGDPEAAGALRGSEQALEDLGSAWFAPALADMLRQPEEKRGLWHLLKRVMPRWARTA